MSKNKLEFKFGVIAVDFGKIIDQEIAEEAREEAKEIVRKTIQIQEEVPIDGYSYKNLTELYLYHIHSKGNVFCMHLDSMKSVLVKVEKMEEGGFFGEPEL